MTDLSGPKSVWWRRYVEWWAADLPPMHGLLRFVVYTGLLLLALDHDLSPLRGIERYERTSPELFRSYGLIALLGVPYIAPELLRILVLAVKAAWVCAAIGLFSRASAVVTAIGVAFLQGMFLGSNALNHNWFLATYTLIALCFSRTADPWSVDYHLTKWWTGRPPRRGGALADTGFARKMVLVFAVGFYFAAGLSKLSVAGPAWADGHTIAYFAAERGTARPLGPLLADNLWLCSLLAVGSLALELGAPAALFSRRARYALIFGWVGMHIGIRLAMSPRYWENIVCLALLIEWREAARAVRAGLKRAPRLAPGALGGSAVGGVAAAGLLLPLILGVAFFQVSWWPLTNVYMYCSYFSNVHDIRADYPRADFHRPAAVQRIARSYREERPSIEATEHFAFLSRVRLAGDRAEPRQLFQVPGLPSYKQWVLTVVRPVLIEDFAAKPDGRIEFDPEHPDFPAQQFLLEYLPIFQRHVDPGLAANYDRLELTYPLEDGRVVIASVPLRQVPSP